MECPRCGQDNREGARFCGSCAASLAPDVACPACGASNPAGQRFCDACAHALADEAPGSPAPAAEAAPSLRPTPVSYTPKHLADRIFNTRSAIEGERKNVTVLFADLVDSVPLSERTDPEEMHALMDRCFQCILPEVHRYEGTINQFQGDGFMALFGAPLALEDAPRRACLAALAIQRAVAQLRDETRERYGGLLQWRIGIHSGPVVVGRIGDDLRMDYTAVGDTTNLAARLEKAAPPDGILISEATHRLTAAFFDVEDLGSVSLKGKSEPTRVFRVVSERNATDIAAAASAGLTPLCGRKRELSVLEAALDDARSGRGQVVFVVGEAGVGKSRLLHEFRRRVAGEPHTWFMGHCIAYGRATFQAIVDGVRRLMGIEDQDDEASALARIDRAVRGFGDDLDWTLPLLRHLLSLPVGDAAVESLDPLTRRSEVVKALTAIFLSAARQRPLVFVIEDLHWIDPASEEFLEGLVNSAPASRVLLVLTHRPGYEHPFGDRSYTTRLAIQSLSEREMAEMVQSLFDTTELPEPLRALIASKAEGNPLFIEEVVKSLLEDGVLALREGRIELARELSEIAIPDRIQDVLMARIDRLDEGPKYAIQLASVIGREFALRLLQRITEAGEAVHGVVDELRALELIYEKAAHPELAFMFKHALTHDVAYGSVLVQRRKALHGIVGAAIEELYRDRLAEHYEKLAFHFERAEQWDKALAYHAHAAEKAALSYANQAAADHCRRALEIASYLETTPPQGQLEHLGELLGACRFALSEFRASGDAYMRAAEGGEAPALRARNLARAGYSYAWAHDYDTSDRVCERALEIDRKHGATAARSMALACKDHLGLVQGTVFDFALIDESVAAAERAQDGEALVLALTLQAGRLERVGEFDRAIAACEYAVRLADRERLGHMTAFAQWFLGISQTCIGRYGDALATLTEALALCERIGDRAVKPRLLNTLGWCFAEFECHDRAIECNRLSTQLAREMVERGLVPGAPELYANGAINLAGNLLALGDVDDAQRALEPIEEQLGADEDPWMRWRYSLHLLNAQARVALARGEIERALALTRDEREGARAAGSQKLEARALELHARALVVGDARDEAREALDAAQQAADRIGYAPVLWRATSLRSELARRSGDAREADRYAGLVRERIAKLAGTLPDATLSRGFAAYGERLGTNPLER